MSAGVDCHAAPQSPDTPGHPVGPGHSGALGRRGAGGSLRADAGPFAVGRAPLGRGPPRRHPPRPPGADGPRAQPLPHVRRDVGRVGRLRPGRRRRLRRREGRRRGHDRAVERAREAAISYAAYRILLGPLRRRRPGRGDAGASSTRYGLAVLPDRRHRTAGDSPAALGNRIAAAIIASGLADGSNEHGSYTPTGLRAGQRAADRERPGTTMVDPDRWQPLALDAAGRPERHADPRQGAAFVGPHWGHVTPFAMPPGGDDGCPSTRARRRCSHDADARRGLQGRSGRGHPLQQPARRRRRRDASTSRRARWATTPSAPTTAGPPINPVTGAAVRAQRRPARRLRARAGRVLGGRPDVGDAAGPLERARQRGRRLARASSRGSAGRATSSTRSSGT